MNTPLTLLPPARSRGLYAAPLLVATCWMLLGETHAAGQEPASGKVLMVRGMLGVFSLGLDEMAAQLSQQGVDVQVVPASLAPPAIDRIAQQYAAGRVQGPLVLVGHSLGADLLPSLARRCSCQGVCVDLMILIDSTNPSTVPANVQRCANLYQSQRSPHWLPIFRGGQVQAESGCTELVNIDIHSLPHDGQAAGINHFNIEASPWIQQMVIREVLLQAGRPAACVAARQEN